MHKIKAYSDLPSSSDTNSTANCYQIELATCGRKGNVIYKAVVHVLCMSVKGQLAWNVKANWAIRVDLIIGIEGMGARY